MEKVRALLESVQRSVDAVQDIIDGEALQVGDRNMIEREISVVRNGVERLLQDSAAMLEDPTRIE